MDNISSTFLERRHPEDPLHLLATGKLNFDNSILEYLKQVYINYLIDDHYPEETIDLESNLNILFDQKSAGCLSHEAVVDFIRCFQDLGIDIEDIDDDDIESFDIYLLNCLEGFNLDKKKLFQQLSNETTYIAILEKENDNTRYSFEVYQNEAIILVDNEMDHNVYITQISDLFCEDTLGIIQAELTKIIDKILQIIIQINTKKQSQKILQLPEKE